MARSFEVAWEIDDGYSGPAAPHYFEVDASEVEDCESEEEIEEILDSALRKAFEEDIHPYASNRDAFMEWARAVIDKSEDAENA